MKIKRFAYLIGAIMWLSIAGACCANVLTYERYPDVNGKMKDVAVWKPEDNKGRWPALWFYPGLGAAGQSVQNINEGLAKWLKQGYDFPFIIFYTSDGNGWVDPEKEARPLYNWISARPDVDGISVTGLSSGGDWVYRMIRSQFKIVCAVPISINSNDYTASIDSLRVGVPIWHFHGNRDTSPNAPNSSTGFAREYDAKFPGKMKRSVFTNLGHNSWDAVYTSRLTEPTLSGDPLLEQPFDRSIYDWILSHYTTTPPEPEPVKDIVIENYFDGVDLIFKTQSGKTFKVPATEIIIRK